MRERKYVKIGDKYNRLTIIEDLGMQLPTPQSSYKKRIVICECECGKIHKTWFSMLTSGHTKSCGCLSKEVSGEIGKATIYKAIEKNVKHNGTQEHQRLYRIWKNMKSRCTNENTYGYKWYGGKGVIVCDEWYNDFSKFKDWALISGYNDNLTIDRVDPNGNYEPNNCQWLTQSENTIKSNNERRGDFDE